MLLSLFYVPVLVFFMSQTFVSIYLHLYLLLNLIESTCYLFISYFISFLISMYILSSFVPYVSFLLFSLFSCLISFLLLTFVLFQTFIFLVSKYLDHLACVFLPFTALSLFPRHTCLHATKADTIGAQNGNHYSITKPISDIVCEVRHYEDFI